MEDWHNDKKGSFPGSCQMTFLVEGTMLLLLVMMEWVDVTGVHRGFISHYQHLELNLKVIQELLSILQQAREW